VFTHKHRIHPRYSDMDTFGHVNNACYLTYFEEARVNFLNGLMGYDYDWSKQGVILARAEVDFVFPAFFRDEIYIYTRCSKTGTKSFTLEYKMVKVVEGKEEVLANSISVIVMYDYEQKKSIEVPEEWKAKLFIEN
jgi:acyl-CoA thioester hydrolase